MTHLLDGHEPVTRPRRADHLLGASDLTPLPYPHIDRARARRHGLYLVHRAAQMDGDYHGDLLVTGDRISPREDGRRRGDGPPKGDPQTTT